jgi:ribosomal protein S18 acetylase RimI-like enzyme
VHPKHQNKGLAQMLMKKVIENLYYVWYTEFTIGVEKNNTPALHIYQKLWFTIPLWEFFGDTYDTSPYTLYLKN